MKVTFMANGEQYDTRTVDYGGNLTDIPAIPPKKDAGNQVFAGEWCADEQGSSHAVFTNITADMTVYAVYTIGYTVTLQGGTGYMLSAVSGSISPVKEGGSFTFRYVLGSGYQEGNGFAVKVNGMKVPMTAEGNGAYTYTMTDIRENKTVTVVGIEKIPSTGGLDNPGGGDGDKDDSGKKDEDYPQPATSPTDTPQPAEPQTSTPQPAEPQTSTPQPSSPTKPPLTPQSAETPSRRPGTESGTSDNRQPEDDKESENIETSQQTEQPTEQPVEQEQSQTTGITPESLTYPVGKGAVVVTLNNVDEAVCTAKVTDAAAVAHAVLSEEEFASVQQGQVIEIRIDVERLENVSKNDAAVIGAGIEDCQKEIPGLVMGMYVDISMFIRIGDGDWNAIHGTNEPVEIILDIPKELAQLSADFYIMRAHEGEYLLLEDLDDAPETITIQTEAFSTYAILYQMQEGIGKPSAKCGLCHICPTFLGICYFLWLAIFIALVLIIYIIIRKKNRQEEESDK